MASVFAHRAFRATGRLAGHPRSGRVVPELGQDLVREVLLGSYRIIYRLLDDEVQIITIHHGARLLDPGILDRREE
jgi:plasmid stabilization system protein ParE